jgi:hypothetical protein
MRKLWRSLTRREHIAMVFFGLGLLGVILLSVLGSLGLLTGAWAGLIVLVTALFQLAGAHALHQEGRADPDLAWSAVVQLLAMAKRADQAEALAQEAFDSGTSSSRRDVLGRVSVHLSYLQESSIQAAEVWYRVHTDALRDLFSEDQSGN